MKNHTTLLAVAILCILALSACTGETLTGTQTMQPQGNQQGLTTAGTVILQPEMDDLSKPEETGQNTMPGTQEMNTINAYTHILYGDIPSGIADSEFTAELDNLYQTAVKTRDLTVCDDFPNELIALCKTDIQDLEDIRKAELTSDESYCNKISSSQRKEMCKLNIKQVESRSTINMQPSESDYAIMDEAVAKNSLSICDDITTPSVRDNCITNVIYYNKDNN